MNQSADLYAQGATTLCPVRPAVLSTLFRIFGKLPGLAAALALACGGAGAAAATYYVDVNYDQSNGGSDGSASRPFTNITAAVAAANANAGRDAVMIADGVYKSVNVGGYEDFGTAGITITGFVDIYGGYEGMTAGTWSSNRAPRTTVIDLAGAGARAFVDSLPTHNNTGVRYDGLTFVNANHSLPGGAIRCAGGYAVGIFVENCLFSNNVTSGNGGALSANESECNSFVNNCGFIDNAAGGSGGAHLNVVGRLSVDGAVRSDAASVWNVDGSGGSLWISAREIAGTGAVTSVGGAYRTNPGWEERGGGGGRIALRITAAEYQASLSLLACGGKGGPGCPSAVGGAGTIYIEDVNCPQGGGWCIVDNNNVGTNGWTEWPASMWGDAAETLRGVRLTITNAACLRLSTNVIVGNLFLGTNSVLDLNGYTCRVDATRHALAGLVVSNGGALFWGRKGTVFAVR